MQGALYGVAALVIYFGIISLLAWDAVDQFRGRRRRDIRIERKALYKGRHIKKR